MAGVKYTQEMADGYERWKAAHPIAWSPPAEDQIGRFKGVYKNQIPVTDTDKALTAGTVGTVMGATAGTAKYPAAGLDYMSNAATFNPNKPISPYNKPASWTGSVDKINGQVEDIKSASPNAYLAGQVAGALLTAPVTGEANLALKGTQIARAAPTVAKYVAPAITGAAYGGINAYNEKQDLGDAATGATIGGAVGSMVPAVQGAARLAGKYINSVGLSDKAKILQGLIDNNDVAKLREILPNSNDPVSIAKQLVQQINQAVMSPSTGEVAGAAEAVRGVTPLIDRFKPSLMGQVAQGAGTVLSQHPFGAIGGAYGLMTGPHDNWYDPVITGAKDAAIGEVGSHAASKAMGTSLPNVLTAAVPGVANAAITQSKGLSGFLDELRGKWSPPAEDEAWAPPAEDQVVK